MTHYAAEIQHIVRLSFLTLPHVLPIVPHGIGCNFASELKG